MKKTLFIDRDGTIIREPTDEQIDSLDKLSFIPGAITALAKIAAETDFELVMVTNQDGLGTTSFPEENFWPAHNLVMETLAGEGARFAEVFIDRSFPADNSPYRKPGTAMLTQYLAKGVDLKNSFVIGDRQTDVELAKNLGCGAIFLGKERPEGAIMATTDWNEIYKFLRAMPRKSSVSRKTKETDIFVEVNLDGSGKSEISTGVGFFDHMLEQISKHGGIDLVIRAKGDLEVDPHHLIEDTAITLGEAFVKAMGSKKGIERYGFSLPMDDCLAQVAVDFGGRAWLVWEVEFKGHEVGGVPTELFYHFFKSFSDNAKCNLNIKAEGDNDHHKIEGIFKAFAKSVKNGLKPSGDFQLPSTKGIL